MATIEGTRYSLTLPPPVEKDLEMITEELHTTKAEALRRSIVLFKHALQADRVEFYTKEEEGEVSQRILVK